MAIKSFKFIVYIFCQYLCSNKTIVSMQNMSKSIRMITFLVKWTIEKGLKERKWNQYQMNLTGWHIFFSINLCIQLRIHTGHLLVHTNKFIHLLQMVNRLHTVNCFCSKMYRQWSTISENEDHNHILSELQKVNYFYCKIILLSFLKLILINCTEASYVDL